MRGKRRRIKCTRYNGFLVEPFKRNELPKPELSSQDSLMKSPLLSRTDPSVSCLKNQRQQKICPSLELPDQAVTKRCTLDIPFHKLIEFQGDETSKLLVDRKNVEAASKSECHSVVELPNNDNSGGNSLPRFSSTTNNEMPPNSEKLKRKHALCAIFEDIWNPNNSVAPEKPQINGFKQTFHDVFNKAPLVRAKNSDIFSKIDSETTIDSPRHSPSKHKSQDTKKEVSPESRNHSERSPAHFAFTETKSLEIDDCLPPEDMFPDLLLSHEVEIKTAWSGENSSESEEKLNPAENWLRSAQTRCTAQSKLISPQLIIRKTPRPANRRSEHRKKRKRRCRKRRNEYHVTDADDEYCDQPPKPCGPLTGPLKLMTLEDLWIQKEFYLRYLCNYYHISSEGCKGWMISRLHQFILQSVGSSSLSKHRTFKLFRTPQQRPNKGVSWVQLNLQCKTKFLDE